MKKTSVFLLFALTLFLEGNAQNISIPEMAKNEWNIAGVRNKTPEHFDSTFTIDCGPGFLGDKREIIQNTIDNAGRASGLNRVLIRGECGVYGNLRLVGGRHDSVYVMGDGPGGVNYRLSSGPSTVIKFMNIKSDAEKYKVPELHEYFSAGFVLYGPGRERNLGIVESYDPETNKISLPLTENIPPGEVLLLRATRVEGPYGPLFDHLGQFNKVREAGQNSITLEKDFRLTWEHHLAQDNGNDIGVYIVPSVLNTTGISNLGIINDLEGFENRPFLCDERRNPGVPDCPPHISNITLFFVENIHIKNIYSFKPLSRHIYMMRSMHTTIEGSFFNDAYYTAGYGGAFGYGIDMRHYCTLNLIENNIFRNQRSSINANTGSHKNVFAYNYSREAFALTGNRNRPDLRSRNLSDRGNLFEGNWVDRIKNDAYHLRDVISLFGFHNVFLRNHSRYSYLQNEDGREIYFIGNEARLRNTPNHTLAVDILGFDMDSNPVSHDSFVSPDTPHLHLDMISLFYETKPDYFTLTDSLDLKREDYPWPPLGPRISMDSDKDPQPLTRSIPARDRYCEAYNRFKNFRYRCRD